MDLLEITAEDYANTVDQNIPVFCKEEFLELNAYKVEKVRYFQGKKSHKVRFVMAVGEKDKTWRLPFSAPFGMPVCVQKSHCAIEYYYSFVEAMIGQAKADGIEHFEIFLPPLIYEAEYIQKLLGAFLYNGFHIQHQDLNYSLNLKKIGTQSYEEYMQRNARKNLTIALKSELQLTKCETPEDKKEAYRVIKVNRESKGYPLRMTQDQVMDTIKIVNHDFFLLEKDHTHIAAAVVFRVTDKIAQVVYWGDIPDVGAFKPINYLSYELSQYFYHEGFEHLDIGPSTENGIPNFGLCEFKESIGCETSAKFKICLDLDCEET